MCAFISNVVCFCKLTELAQLCGVAAILRYPCPGIEDDVEEDEDVEEEDESEELLEKGLFSSGVIVTGDDHNGDSAP